MAELMFHGAAGEVTGSMHMLRVDDGWVAIDCGLFQGRRSESEEKNRQWPVPPKEIRAVVLSHAHIDHTGRLPRLVRDGFDGPVYCTPATRDLCAIMLPDSAHIQVEDIKYVNKRRAKKNLPPVDLLYEHRDAFAAIAMMHSIPYKRWFHVVPGLRARYREAGHMLGSAGVELAISDGNREKIVYFSGDVGRDDKPILRDPEEMPQCDVLICESTYGGRINEGVDDAKELITQIVKRTYERGGRVIIPAFSVGRTQTIVYFLHEQMEAGNLPKHPVFVDSPLAVNATEVFKLHPECYDEDAVEFQIRTGDMLGAGCCTYIRSVEESKALHRRRNPCTIISASGMCEAGRIRHHLKNGITKKKNTVLIPGYQAQHTLGRRLADGAERVNIFHRSYRVRAEVIQIHGFSAHADQVGLMQMVKPLASSVGQAFLVHGEPDQSEVMAELMREAGFASVTLAQRGQRVEF